MPPERSHLINSDLDIFIYKPMYFWYAAYQSAFVIWISAPDPLGRPHFLILVFPFTTVFFLVAAFLDAILVTHDNDKDLWFWFFDFSCGLCGGGSALEEETYPLFNLTPSLSHYDSLHSKLYGCYQDSYEINFYPGLNSSWGALQFCTIEHFLLGNIVEECVDGCFL